MTDFEHDSHVRAYYDQRDNSPGKFEGETRALRLAYETSMNGFAEDEFGGDDDIAPYTARVLFDHYPFIICFQELSNGFVREITNREYEYLWAEYIEDIEDMENEESESD